jgi:DNA-directed RNA polymerase subunit M/transcription elongation factor TFIIS
VSRLNENLYAKRAYTQGEPQGKHSKPTSDRLSKESLKRQTLTCPKCKAAWFVIQASGHDFHICKSCGHRFSIA